MSPAEITRPPTVVLTEDNLRRLQRYPRPPRDNGIGLHFHLDLRDLFIEQTIEHLQEIRASWTLIYAEDELQTERAARACFAAGIMPVIRIGKLIDEQTDPVPFVEGLRRAWRAAGWGGDQSSPVEPLYVQLFNEPEDPREWIAQVTPPDGPARFAAKWAADAPRIVDAGGFVGIQVLSREPLARTVDAVANQGCRKCLGARLFCTPQLRAESSARLSLRCHQAADRPGHDDHAGRHSRGRGSSRTQPGCRSCLGSSPP